MNCRKLQSSVWAVGLLLFFGGTAAAAELPKVTTSSSAGFIVVDGRQNPAARPLTRGSSVGGELYLDPSVLAVSAERVRSALERELDGPWLPSKRVILVLRSVPARSTDNEVTLVSTRYRDGWRYETIIPERIEPIKLVRGIIQVLLLDAANHADSERCAEIPLWLTEGLTAEVIARVGPELALEGAREGLMVRSIRFHEGTDSLKAARQLLRGRSGLTFAEFSFPAAEQIAGPRQAIYQALSQVWVRSLVDLPDGRKCLWEMLPLLSEHWNWQKAFLAAFGDHFQSLLDMEKWWSMLLVEVTQREALNLWSDEFVLATLNSLLLTRVTDAAASNSIPAEQEITLSALVSDTPFHVHAPVLKRKIADLQHLRVHAPLETQPLIDAYLEVLSGYLREQAALTKLAENRRQPGLPARFVQSRALRDLGRLEQITKPLKSGAAGWRKLTP